MEELVRQLVAALEVMQKISLADQDELGEWGGAGNGSRDLLEDSRGDQRGFPSDSQELMLRLSEFARVSRASRLAYNHAQRLELSVFRILRDLSRDEAMSRGADRVWDLMEERLAIRILDPEDDLVLPETPEMKPSAAHYESQAREYVEGVRKAVRESRNRQKGSLDAIIARQDELLSQALAEARAMLG